MIKQDKSSLNTFFCDKPVVKGCYEPIYIIFQTLLLSKHWKQQDLADSVGIDKSVISRICHGLYVPVLDLRLKIAKSLGVDSSLIWRYQDLPYIKNLIKNQKETNENGK